MKTSVKILVGLAILGSAVCSAGNSRAVNFSLIPNIALYKKTMNIQYFSLAIWGENQHHGFALGLVNGFRGRSGGVAIGLFNYGGSYGGGQLAAVNWASGHVGGFQGGFLNVASGGLGGVQLGGVNYTKNLSGAQIGLINYADRGRGGMQVGIINIMPGNKNWFSAFPANVAPFMIIANWNF